MAIINGHFDLAMICSTRGADPNLPAINGVSPLYAVLNVQWAPSRLSAAAARTSSRRRTYLELMEALLDKGADPNARVRRKVWYQATTSI